MKSLCEEVVGEEKYNYWFKQRKTMVLEKNNRGEEGKGQEGGEELRRFVCGYMMDVLYSVCKAIGVLWRGGEERGMEGAEEEDEEKV